MSAIVPFVSGENLGTAFSMGRGALKYGRRVARGVKRARRHYDDNKESYERAQRTIGSAWKRYRSRSKATTRTAEGATTTTRQNGGTVIDNDPIIQRVLRISSFPWPSQGAGVGQRLGSTIHLAGMKVCEKFHNFNPYPVTVHYAIIQPRGGWDQTTPNFNVDFFRETTGEDRATDFVDAQQGTQYDFRYDCYSINPDKWHIITHQKRHLTGRTYDPESTTPNIPANVANSDVWFFERYYRVNKAFTFKNASDLQPYKPLFKVFWWQALNFSDWGANPPLELIQRSAHHIMYFRPSQS